MQRNLFDKCAMLITVIKDTNQLKDTNEFYCKYFKERRLFILCINSLELEQRKEHCVPNATVRIELG